MVFLHILEQCKIKPPPNSLPQISIPLTFLDLPWLFFPPSQTLFFYDYPHSTSHFLSTTLPTLKTSLSLALRQYFPFAGKLYYPAKPTILYTEGDYVSFTVSESNNNFDHLTSYEPRSTNEFHPLLPRFDSDVSNEVVSLLALQVTIFPNCGICLGFVYRHVVADQRTFNNFIKTWASLFRNPNLLIKSSPFHDRTAISNDYGLEELFLNEWYEKRNKLNRGMVIKNEKNDFVRATFVIGLEDMEKIRRLIVGQCELKSQPRPVHLSSYVVTCALVWVCLIKTHARDCSRLEDPIFFGFVAGGLTRVGFPVPAMYVGVCVGFGRCEATWKDLIGEDGIVVAASVMGNKIKELDKTMFNRAEKWVSDWDVLFGSELHVMVSGSPKVDLYETSFGWGRVKKIEDISIDSTRAISLMQSRDLEGGIEVGLVLTRDKMDAFTFLLTQALKSLS